MVANAVGKIAVLRKRIEQIKARLARKSMAMLAKQRRQLALQAVHERLKLIRDIPRARALVKEMVQCRNYGGALEVVDKTLAVLSSKLRGIRGVECVGGTQRNSLGGALSRMRCTCTQRRA